MTAASVVPSTAIRTFACNRVGASFATSLGGGTQMLEALQELGYFVTKLRKTLVKPSVSRIIPLSVLNLPQGPGAHSAIAWGTGGLGYLFRNCGLAAGEYLPLHARANGFADHLLQVVMRGIEDLEEPEEFEVVALTLGVVALGFLVHEGRTT